MDRQVELLHNQVLEGDCVDILDSLPAESVDLVFADPPYNLQLRQDLWRPNQPRVDAVDDDWDQFPNFSAYDEFTHRWLAACRRVLKPTGRLVLVNMTIGERFGSGIYERVYDHSPKSWEISPFVKGDMGLLIKKSAPS